SFSSPSGVTWLDDERDPNSSTRERRKGPPGPFRMSPLRATQTEAHWPFLAPVTWLSEPSESPICGAGELPKQLRLPWIVFVTYSFPSGSASTLPLRLTAPFTWLRMKPIQNPLEPVMLTPPLIWLSSIVVHVMSNGPPNGPEPPCDSTPPLIVV